jgi:hypothetical protein
MPCDEKLITIWSPQKARRDRVVSTHKDQSRGRKGVIYEEGLSCQRGSATGESLHVAKCAMRDDNKGNSKGGWTT